MTASQVNLVRPVPYLDAAQLERLWAESEVCVGSVVTLEVRRYRVQRLDRVGAEVRRVYLEELGSGCCYALVIRGRAD